MTLDDLKRLYERETGKSWSADEGVPWLNIRVMEDDLNLYKRRSILDRDVFITLSDKAGWLRQSYCYVCKPQTLIGPISLRIRPESWQYIKSINKSAFKKSIEYHLSTRLQLSPYAGPICLSFLFVCSTKRKIKDLDNMAKLVMDALKDVVMEDDQAVDHLNLLRLSHEGTEEFISFQLGIASVNNHDDVLHKKFWHGWPYEEIRIEDFLESAKPSEVPDKTPHAIR